MHTVEIYAPENNYIRTKTHHHYNTHLTVKELYSKLTLCFSWDYWQDLNPRGYLQQFKRIMRSLDDDGNIVKEQWLKKIAENDFHYQMASKLLGIEYDNCTDEIQECNCEGGCNIAEKRLEKIKSAIYEGVKNHKITNRLVAEAKNEMAFSKNNLN
jgi:hypothetical protein